MLRRLILPPFSLWLILLIACLIKAFLSLGSTPQTCRTNNILARLAWPAVPPTAGELVNPVQLQITSHQIHAVLHAVIH